MDETPGMIRFTIGNLADLSRAMVNHAAEYGWNAAEWKAVALDHEDGGIIRVTVFTDDPEEVLRREVLSHPAI